MPLNPSSFFIPPAGVPFLMEDKYLRGGFRVVATNAERDAISTAARKVGMRVLVADASLIEYQLVGGTNNASWQIYNGDSGPHTHEIEDVTGLADALAGKAASDHLHAISDVSGLQSELDGKTTPTDLTTGLSGKADSVHAHGIADVAELQTTLDSKASSGELTTGLAGKADSVHTHMVSDIQDLQDFLDDKVSTQQLATGLATKSNTVHAHSISDVTGLQADLDGKAASSHIHAVADVAGLQTTLNAKLDKAGGTVSGNLTVTGDLVIQGSNTIINTTELEVSDPIITVAKNNATGVLPYAGVKVERGGTDAFLVFNEATDRWSAYLSADDLSTAGTLSGIEASTFYGALSGNASSATLAASATKLATARAISLTGDATATGSFDGTAPLSLTVTVVDDSHNHIISNVDGLQAALDLKSDSTHTHSVATTSADGLMSSTDKTKLNGIATAANNYVHPTGDGNLHVPATSTTNNLRVLKAGATAGSAAWGQVSYGELTNVPSAFVPSAHSNHVISDVSGLQSALDAKLATTGIAANSSLLQGFASSTGAGANTIALRDSAGKITAVDFTMTSDMRHKDLVAPINDDEALQKVLSWDSFYYRIKGQDRIMPGHSAQQLLTITPDLVDTSDPDKFAVSYALTSAYYAAAFRAVYARLEKLENDSANNR